MRSLGPALTITVMQTATAGPWSRESASAAAIDAPVRCSTAKSNSDKSKIYLANLLFNLPSPLAYTTL